MKQTTIQNFFGKRVFPPHPSSSSRPAANAFNDGETPTGEETLKRRGSENSESDGGMYHYLHFELSLLSHSTSPVLDD